jgi:hypothetical protein
MDTSARAWHSFKVSETVWALTRKAKREAIRACSALSRHQKSRLSSTINL